MKSNLDLKPPKPIPAKPIFSPAVPKGDEWVCWKCKVKNSDVACEICLNYRNIVDIKLAHC